MRSQLILDEPPAQPPPEGYIRIPRLDVAAGAGPGQVPAEHPEIVEHLDVLATWVRTALGVADTQSLRVIGVKGDSMSPTMNHGDLAFADTSVQRFDGEGIYAFIWQEHLTIKRLRMAGEARLAIHSDNSAAYPPEIIAADTADQIVICARVVGWWSLRRW